MKCKVETFVDTENGSQIQQIASIDTDEIVEFIGSANINTPQGALPIQFKIEAKDIDEAFEKFVSSAEDHIEYLKSGQDPLQFPPQ